MNKKIIKMFSLSLLTCILIYITCLSSICFSKETKQTNNSKKITHVMKTKYYAPFGELTTLEKTEKNKVSLVPLVDDTEVSKPTEEPKASDKPKIVKTANVKKKKTSKIYKTCPLSSDLQKHINNKCKKYNISTNVVIALIEAESNFKANTMGDQGRSYGLMQIQKRYHIKRMNKLNVKNLLNAYSNTSVGIDYLAEIYKSCNGNWHKTLMVYNGGWNYAKRNINRGIYSTKYSRKVMQRANYYKSKKN